VLPFANLSEDKANAYFAEGIQEEILTRLAKIADLKVIARTSTQQYQSKPGNLSEIAKQLGVANILVGSVQKAAERQKCSNNFPRLDPGGFNPQVDVSARPVGVPPRASLKCSSNLRSRFEWSTPEERFLLYSQKKGVRDAPRF
jgi:hypothetical protein